MTKSSVKKFLSTDKGKTVLWILFLVVLLGVLAKTGFPKNPLEWFRQVNPYLAEKNPAWANFAPNSATSEWMDKLAKAENCSPEGTWDTGSYSYGKYCFKKGTWEQYASSTKIAPYAETTELMNFIGDEEAQDRVVFWMISEDYKNLIGHWKTSIVKKEVGLPPKPIKI